MGAIAVLVCACDSSFVASGEYTFLRQDDLLILTSNTHISASCPQTEIKLSKVGNEIVLVGFKYFVSAEDYSAVYSSMSKIKLAGGGEYKPSAVYYNSEGRTQSQAPDNFVLDCVAFVISPNAAIVGDALSLEFVYNKYAPNESSRTQAVQISKVVPLSWVKGKI